MSKNKEGDIVVPVNVQEAAHYIFSDNYGSASDFSNALVDGKVGLISKETCGGGGASLVMRNENVQPGLNAGSLYSQGKHNTLQVWSGTPNTSPLDGADSRVGIASSMGAYGSQHGTAIRANLYNQSDDGQGCTAFYGYAAGYTGSNWSAAVHGETRHKGNVAVGVNSESAGFTTDGTMIGMNAHMTTGNPATHPEGGTPASPEQSYAFKTTGSGYTSQPGVGDYGRWAVGLMVDSNSIREDIGVGVQLNGNMKKGVDLTLATPSSSAIALAADSFQSFESSCQIRLQYTSSATAMEFRNGSNVNLQINNNGTVVTGGQVRASKDNKYACGGGSYRWTAVYAKNGSIQTSDRNLKTDVRELSRVEGAIAREVKGMVRSFRWKNDEDTKMHFGVIAQEVASVFEKHGLDPLEYSLFDITELERGEGRLWGINYSELLAFIVSAI